MRFKIGEIVRVGGSKGQLVKIVDYDGSCYVLKDLNNDNCTGYLSEDYLRKYKTYEQLKLF